jgi:nitroreductase
MSLTSPEVDDLKKAPAIDRVLPVFLLRWSPRSFAARAVDPADLRTIFEAVRWTQSSYNEQPWRYLVGERGSETYVKILNSLGEWNRLWAKNVPVLIVGTASPTFSHNKTPNGYAFHDLGAADATLCYQAAALGIHTHQMAGYDREAARAAFGVPADFVMGSAIALGYLGEPDSLENEGQRTSETQPRTRKQVADFVYTAWNEPTIWAK